MKHCVIQHALKDIFCVGIIGQMRTKVILVSDLTDYRVRSSYRLLDITNHLIAI